MDLLLAKDLVPLIASYEADIVAKKARALPRSIANDKDKRLVREAMSLLRAGKIGNAQISFSRMG